MKNIKKLIELKSKSVALLLATLATFTNAFAKEGRSVFFKEVDNSTNEIGFNKKLKGSIQKTV